MNTTKTELIATEDQGGDIVELNRSGAAAAATAEIQSALAIARRFPRDEDSAYQRLVKATDRPAFREKCRYEYPRGKTTVTGPSVVLAREAARCWGNLRYGFSVLNETAAQCHVRGWAWDLETNARVEQDAFFKLLIYRKPNPEKGIAGGWQTPDEREKRELVNKHGAVAERNCLLKLLPADVVEDVLRVAREKERAGNATDTAAKRRAMLAAFASINVDAAELAQYLGHPLDELTPDELVTLRGIYSTIHDGTQRWSDYYAPDTGGDKSDRAGKQSATEAARDLAAKAAASAKAAKSEPKSESKADAKPTAQESPESPKSSAGPAADSGAKTEPQAASAEKAGDQASTAVEWATLNLPDGLVAALEQATTPESALEIASKWANAQSVLELHENSILAGEGRAAELASKGKRGRKPKSAARDMFN